MTFDALLTMIEPKLRAIIYRLGRSGVCANADDMYQETVFHLWEAFTRGDLDDKTESYIVQKGYFFLKNFLRTANKKVDTQSVYFDDMVTAENISFEDLWPAEGAEKSFRDVEFRLMVEDMCKCLTEREQLVVSLLEEGLTARQIGSRLGISHVMVLKIERAIRAKCAFLEKELV